MAFKFESLKVWQKAVDFTTKIHELTKKFPNEELYILTGQIKRAADSIALNIAEAQLDKVMLNLDNFLDMRLGQESRSSPVFLLLKTGV